jgi:chromate transporter
MNAFVLYLFLVKATLTSFSGLGSLPMIHQDFVVERHVLTDRQLNIAVAAGRVGPGPAGLYVVSVGYSIAGIPGAIAGWAAMITPAFLVIPLLRYLGARAERPRIKSAIRASMLASAGLLLGTSAQIAQTAVTDVTSAIIVIVSFALLAFTKIDSLWLICGSAAVGLARVLLTPWTS